MMRGEVTQATLDWERMFHNTEECRRSTLHQLERHGRILTTREKVMARVKLCAADPLPEFIY